MNRKIEMTEAFSQDGIAKLDIGTILVVKFNCYFFGTNIYPLLS